MIRSVTNLLLIAFTMVAAIATSVGHAANHSNLTSPDKPLQIWLHLNSIPTGTELKVEISSTENVGALQFEIVFPPEGVAGQIEPAALLPSALMESNLVEPGRLRVAVVSSEPILGSGTLAKLVFDSVTSLNPETDFRIENIKAWHLDSLAALPVEVASTEAVGQQITLDSAQPVEPNEPTQPVAKPNENHVASEFGREPLGLMGRDEIRKMIVEVWQTLESNPRPVQLVLPSWVSFLSGAGSMLIVLLLLRMCCSKLSAWRAP